MYATNSTPKLPEVLGSEFFAGSWVVYILCLPALVGAIIQTFSHFQGSKGSPRGCRRFGLEGPSNLADEFDSKYAQGTPDQSEDHRWKVKSLWVYPVKSCRGVELEKGAVIKSGMEYDRQFSLAQWKETRNKDTPDGQKGPLQWTFITQREFPLLARVRTEVWVPDPSLHAYSDELPEVQSGGVIVLKFPRQDHGLKGLLSHLSTKIIGEPKELSFQVPFNPTQAQIQANGYSRETMKIWKDSPIALNMTSSVRSELNELKQFLGVKHPLGLFRVDTEHYRQVFRNAPRKETLGYQPIVGFADAYPLHLLNLASIHDLANRTEDGPPELSICRFRSNIVVTGPLAFAEDHWKKIRIGEGTYDVSCRTSRCKLPNTDQITGQKHLKEPDNTLRSYRRVDKGAGSAASLGMQMVPILESGNIKVGDTVEVLELGEHFYIKQ